MDRQGLARWSLGLSDAEFPLALAALGVLTAFQGKGLAPVHDGSTWRVDALSAFLAEGARRDGGLLCWKPPRLSRRKAAPQVSVPAKESGRTLGVDCPAPRDLVDLWRTLATREQPRLAIQVDPAGADGALAFAELLSRADIGAAGVFIETDSPSDGRADWRWPVKLGMLPEDPIAAPFEFMTATGQLEEARPYRFVFADRDYSRLEILVIGRDATDALTLLLTRRPRLRCGLVILSGLGGETLRTAEPILRLIADRLSAQGVAVADRLASPDLLARTLDDFCAKLSHNTPLDVALREAFGRDAILLANRELLRASGLHLAARRVSAKLRGLPAGSRLIVPGKVVAQLSLPRLDTLESFNAPEEYVRPPGRRTPASRITPAEAAEALANALPGFRFERESNEASAISRLSRIVRRADRETAGQKAARFVRQKSFVSKDGALVETRGPYEVGRNVLLQVRIGPRRGGEITAPTPFPDEKLPSDVDGHRLLIVFHEPRQFDAPLSKEIRLPRAGDSETAEFVFAPKETGDFMGRVSVLHRGRVLQTVLLRTRVVAPGARTAEGDDIRLEDEMVVRRDWSGLGRRREFDLTIVLNHTPAGDATMTAVAGDRVWTDRLDDLKPVLLEINNAISNVARSVQDYGDGLDQGENPKLLVRLARLGGEILSQLREDFDAIRSDAIEYLQLVSARPDAVLPLEFLYDFEPPAEGARICPQHKEALSGGQCPKTCARASDRRAYVCPMGFWGLKKVIERHMRPLREPGVAVAVESEPVDGRDSIEIADNIVIGYSAEVKREQIASLAEQVRETFHKTPTVVANWNSWVDAVKTTRPALLVAFPHNEGEGIDIRLEIGGDKLKAIDVTAEHVRYDGKPDPVVFLLGCDVAGTAQDFASHIRHFRQQGAAVVISTVATVFGAHAVRVGEEILSRLLDGKNEKKFATIGEAIRDAKRHALLDSVPMALCVVAFGDADWRL